MALLIQERMQALGMRQRELAKIAGMSLSNLKRIIAQEGRGIPFGKNASGARKLQTVLKQLEQKMGGDRGKDSAVA